MRFLISLALFASVVACAGDDTCADEPAYAGDATDETWVVMKDNEDNAKSGDDAPVFTSPKNNATLSAATAPKFAWDSTLKVAAWQPAASTRAARAPARDAWDALVAAVIPAAHAHEPPITSDLYWLQFVLPDQACVASILTTDLEVTPDDDTWKLVAEHKGTPIEVRIISAYVEQNVLTEGPFAGKALTFTIE